MKLKRGFQRIASVLIALALPGIWFLAYQESTHVARYEPRLLSHDFPDTGHAGRKAVFVNDVGIFYFPAYLSQEEIQEAMNGALDRATSMQFPDSGSRQSIKEFAAAVRSKYPSILTSATWTWPNVS